MRKKDHVHHKKDHKDHFHHENKDHKDNKDHFHHENKDHKDKDHFHHENKEHKDNKDHFHHENKGHLKKEVAKGMIRLFIFRIKKRREKTWSMAIIRTFLTSRKCQIWEGQR
ncbi:hypothetical protein BsIDN1_48220 [Bacillus safensis]|uniref:Uncharacterized protein n=1 Tax=Bacillus safensis TaxID=561879 RepID=A0A5S9MGC1_BACIA|nr:hypothetical protein BsIDN1_48220 [Bacillus safensis]